MENSNVMIAANTAAIENSAATIQENTRAVVQSTEILKKSAEAIEKNTKLVESTTGMVGEHSGLILFMVILACILLIGPTLLLVFTCLWFAKKINLLEGRLSSTFKRE